LIHYALKDTAAVLADVRAVLTLDCGFAEAIASDVQFNVPRRRIAGFSHLLASCPK
jgi:hypothetical protein